jgi:molybdate transport system ATP-binding protein
VSLAIELTLRREHFSLELHTELPGAKFSAIYGHSGAGKTTLLRWIAGLEHAPGSLSFNGQTWQAPGLFVPTQQRQIAYVFQDARLFPHLTVRGNLEYAYQRRFNDRGPSIAEVTQWFELGPMLAGATDNLSGGERQRVALARALLSSPQLILMDEPLGSLDPLGKARIMLHLEQLHRVSATPVVYVSHDIEEVSRLADHLLILEGGRVSAQGPLIELSSRHNLRLNHEEQAAAIIEARIECHDNRYQLTQLQIDDSLPLFISRSSGEPGARVRVRIPARDVSLSLSPADDSSILNILPATVDAIEDSSNARALVRLQVAGQFLLARLTRKSIDRLQLTTGKVVYAQIKSVALLSAAL